MASRDLAALLPEVADKVRAFVDACSKAGVDVLVYCTYRDALEQDDLYAQGRTKPGPVVTRARGWQSWHQYKRAADAVPLRGGKPLWKYDEFAPEWIVFREQAAAAGLEWAGGWTRFKEFVHVQDTGGLTLAQAYSQVHGGEPPSIT